MSNEIGGNWQWTDRRTYDPKTWCCLAIILGRGTNRLTGESSHLTSRTHTV